MRVYKFFINDREVNPIYSDDAVISKDLAAEQMIYRTKLTGKIKLIKSDFEWLKLQPLDTLFTMYIQRLSGYDWVEIAKANFTKLNCIWNDDDKIVELKITAFDVYEKFINIAKKEVNVVELAPEIQKINYRIRPIMQSYIMGSKILTCYQSGSYWEEEVNEPVSDHTELVITHKFGLVKSYYEANIVGDGLPNGVAGGYLGNPSLATSGDGIYKLVVLWDPIGAYFQYGLFRVADNELMFVGGSSVEYGESGGTELSAYSPDASGTITVYSRYVTIYQRLVMSSDNYGGLSNNLLPLNDIVEINRNYKYVRPFPDDFYLASAESSTEPTKFGLNDAKKYFVEPTGFDKYYPAAKSSWLNCSIWFNMTEAAATDFDNLGYSQEKLNDAYLLSSVISKILQKFYPDITHEPTEDYSEFLYANTNPVSEQAFKLLITPKTNVFYKKYDKPAQVANITLDEILEMLKTVYKCYWFIQDNKLKFEHITWFMRGSQYAQPADVAADLTVMVDRRNGKPIEYGQGTYSYDNSVIPSRLEFGWMDQVSSGFEGFPIEILSNFAKEGQVEKKALTKFTTDIDYVIANYTDVSRDGFMLFAAVENSGELELPLVERVIDNANVDMQNGYLSWTTLHPTYHRDDMPGIVVSINGLTVLAQTTKKLKVQELIMPANGVVLGKLIKTSLGNGFIDKISLSLTSLTAKVTLRHDTTG